MHPEHGSMTPSGYRVGDLIAYSSSRAGRPQQYAVVQPSPANRRDVSQYPWGYWYSTEQRAIEAYSQIGEHHLQYSSSPTTLIRAHNEGSNAMTISFNGEDFDASRLVAEVTEGEEYLVVYPRDYHDFGFVARARESVPVRGRTIAFEITSWVKEGNGFTPRQYPVGYSWNAAPDAPGTMNPSCLILTVAAAPATASDAAYDGTPGEFVGHDGQIPEPGAIVRGMNTDTRQIEGLFLRMDGDTEATIEAKRRRRRNSGGTFGEWEEYENAARRNVRVEGALIFKPGANTTPAEPEPAFNRREVVVDRSTAQAVHTGDILSARGYDDSRHIYRGPVVRNQGDGVFYVNATHKHRITDSYSTSGVYDWVKLPAPQEVRIYGDYAEGRENWDRAAWTWEQLAPGQKPTDPKFDPRRKTPYTGMKIGDLAVGLRVSGGRDTVQSWVRGEIIKWDTRSGNPVIKVTDPMESDVKVDTEATVSRDDTYPALADPKGADPEEFKKTLRLYLIGRHKRGDFCRGGLNTMLAAFGIPLYETRRRATIVLNVDYDPNETDLYQVQRQLQSGMTAVSSLSLDERSGADFEVERDQTTG